MNSTKPSPIRLTDSVLLDLYKIAVDEYRFQVTLNWNRTQYYLAFNVGLLGVATGLLQLVDRRVIWVVVGLYFAGAVCCVLSLAASHVQQRYYWTTRDRMKELERKLGIDTVGITTTPGMGSTVKRLGKVTTMNKLVLSILGGLNLIGVIVVGLSAFGKN